MAGGAHVETLDVQFTRSVLDGLAGAGEAVSDRRDHDDLGRQTNDQPSVVGVRMGGSAGRRGKL